MGGLGLGLFSIRHLLRCRLGLVYVPCYAPTCLALLVRVASRRVTKRTRLAIVWSVRRIRRAHRTGSPFGGSTVGPLDSLPEISPPAVMDRSLDCRCTRCSSHYVAVAGAELRPVSQVHSSARGLRPGTLHWQQWILHSLG